MQKQHRRTFGDPGKDEDALYRLLGTGMDEFKALGEGLSGRKYEKLESDPNTRDKKQRYVWQPGGWSLRWIRKSFL